MSTYADPGYFERLYESDPDPWKFASSEYERDKYAATMAALPPGRFARCFEVGCSIGVLTHELAQRCDALLGVDVAENALDQARTRLRDMPWVRFVRMAVPTEWPEGSFDLVLFSEVLYYLGDRGPRGIGPAHHGQPRPWRHGGAGELARQYGRRVHGG